MKRNNYFAAPKLKLLSPPFPLPSKPILICTAVQCVNDFVLLEFLSTKKPFIMHTAITAKQRIQSIDLLRGIIMVIMALDHSRDFFHSDSWLHNPLDTATTSPFLYFTRWITHFCAPNFVFLSGLSVWLQSKRKTKKVLSRFLIIRGLWLILLEVTIINIGIQADIYCELITLQVIWVTGLGMVMLGLMLWLPFSAIFMTGLLIVLGHNSLDFAEAARHSNVSFFWHLMHLPALVPLWGNHKLFILYPFLPWIGIILMGYCCGKILTDFDKTARNKILLLTGIGLLLFFTVLRFSNIYGDPVHWSSQKNFLYTFLSFMNVQKYPPSLLFICATIGPGLIFLSLADTVQNRFSKIMIVYGRVPMFYYLLHFFSLSFLHVLYFLFKGHSVAEGIKGYPGVDFKFTVPGEGVGLFIVYMIWIAVVAALYPFCKWYDKHKTSHPEKWWLSYL